MQLYTCVFAKRCIASRIQDLAIEQVKTGFSGDWGNKGSILVRFVLDDTSIVLANNHLAAGEGQLEKRRRDVESILERARFPPAKPESRLAYSTRGTGTNISDHEIVFFAGK